MHPTSWELNDPGKPDPDYCVYCNQRFPQEQMTEEHVIPECVGGARLKIPACAKCNNRMGATIDILLARVLMLRIHAMRPGKSPARHEHHRGMVRLKDKRELHGCLFVEFLTDKEYRFAFSPDFTQPDGSRWLPEEACKGNRNVPPSISVLRPDDVEWHCILMSAGFQPLAGTEPAMLKIVLGFLHRMWGKSYTSTRAFDLFRDAVKVLSVPVTTGSFPGAQPRTAPVPVIPGTHLVWGGCHDNGRFVGGVSLYGQWTYEFTIANFGLTLEGRVCGIPVYGS